MRASEVDIESVLSARLAPALAAVAGWTVDPAIRSGSFASSREVGGDQTAPVFPPIITKLAEAMASGEVQVFTGAGHPIMVEQPKDFAEAITAFVRRHTT